jgi:transcriptional regulator with XRE-family HTH domain
MTPVNHRLPAESTISYHILETIGYMIGDRLRELRLEAGMTQPEFAAIAGTTKQYVGRLEKGFNKDPNPKLIEQWARHFKVRMEWITTGKTPKAAASLAASRHPGPESQLERLDASIILRTIRRMREATKKVEGESVDVEADPELFAEILRLTIIETAESGDGERRIWATSRQSGGTTGATSQEEDGQAEGATRSRPRRRA